jgi:hypothetical protein
LLCQRHANIQGRPGSNTFTDQVQSIVYFLINFSLFFLSLICLPPWQGKKGPEAYRPTDGTMKEAMSELANYCDYDSGPTTPEGGVAREVDVFVRTE